MNQSAKEKRRTAIIGGSLDGKTFLAIGISRGLWRRRKIRSLVFDPFMRENDWGNQALVFSNFEKFQRIAFMLRPSQNIAVFWDEGTSTGGRDRDNLKFFTAIRHNSPEFFFIGHGFATMLPIMRGSLSEVILAVRDPDDAADWAKLMCDRDVLQATTLKKYEFIHKRKHEPVRILRHTAAEIQAGILIP